MVLHADVVIDVLQLGLELGLQAVRQSRGTVKHSNSQGQRGHLAQITETHLAFFPQSTATVPPPPTWAHRHVTNHAAALCCGRQLQCGRMRHTVRLDKKLIARHVGHQDVQQLEAQAGAVDGEWVASVILGNRPVEELPRCDDCDHNWR